jgi:hypothetical protein
MNRTCASVAGSYPPSNDPQRSEKNFRGERYFPVYQFPAGLAGHCVDETGIPLQRCRHSLHP